MSSEKYDAQKFVNAQQALTRAKVQLQEHFENVEITCSFTDSTGAVFSTTVDWSEDTEDDDEDDKIKPK
jgi:hypothetical protein